MNAAVVPEPSVRCVTTIFVSGNVTPGLSCATRGSRQFVIWPRNIPAIVSAESCSGCFNCGRLYVTHTGPAVSGICSIGFIALSALSSSG